MSGQGEHDDKVETARQVCVTVGETFDVVVDDLPGAGYQWVVRGLPDGIAVVGDDALPTPSDRVGGAARRSVRLRAEAAGTYELALVLVRSWEPPDVAPAGARRLTVEVRDVRP